MTAKQKTFAMEYLRNGFNARQAAKHAGYSDLNGTPSEVRWSPPVAAYISEQLAKEAMPADEVIGRLGRIAKGSVKDFYRTDGGMAVFDIQAAFENGGIDNVKKITKTRAGITIELHDPQVALDKLAKHHGIIDRQLVAQAIADRTGAAEVTDDDIIAIARDIESKRARSASGEGAAGVEQDPAEPDPTDGPMDTD